MPVQHVGVEISRSMKQNMISTGCSRRISTLPTLLMMPQTYRVYVTLTLLYLITYYCGAAIYITEYSAVCPR